MFENLEETKEWFQGQNLETKIRWVELWDEGEMEELESRTGDHYDSFCKLLEEVQEARRDTDKREPVIDELRTEGFELPVAASIYEAAASDTATADATYLRRNSSGPDEIRSASQIAIRKLVGEPNIFADSEASEDLVERADRLLLNTIAPQLIKSYSPIEFLQEYFIENYGFNENQASAFFEPISGYLHEIEQAYAYSRIIQSVDQNEEIVSQQKELQDQINELNNRIKRIERQIEATTDRQDYSDDTFGN